MTVKFNILYDKYQIEDMVERIAYNIFCDYEDGDEIVLIGNLKGSYVFLSDLSRKLSFPHLIDFICLSSYGEFGNHQVETKFLLDTSLNIKNKKVIIIEDIIDSGNTINYLLDVFKSKGANSIKVCSLLKREGVQTDINIDYCGATVEKNRWVVGYGMDYKENFRNFKSIFYITNIGEG